MPVTWEAEGGTVRGELRARERAPGSGTSSTRRSIALTATLDGDAERRRDERSTFGLREIATAGHAVRPQRPARSSSAARSSAASSRRPAIRPPTSTRWKRIIRVAKAHGLNHIRFHSWCPPEAAFVAADELGFYLQVECSSWANQARRIGDGKPVDQWLYDESGPHPQGLRQPSLVPADALRQRAGRQEPEPLPRRTGSTHWKAQDPRRLYTSGAGWPQIPENQFHVTPDPRIQAWGAGLQVAHQRPAAGDDAPTTATSSASTTVPVVSHEIGQWCVYPNFDEIAEVHRLPQAEELRDLPRHARSATAWATRPATSCIASGKLQTLCYKEDIESALRTPGMGGFQLLDLHDFPGQGTALVGVLDPFWDSKGLRHARGVPAASAAATVPLARLAKRVFTDGRDAARPTSRSPTSARRRSKDAVPQLDSSSTPTARAVAARRACRRRTIPVGQRHRARAASSVDLSRIAAPGAATGSSSGSRARALENDWDVWVYPPPVDAGRAGGRARSSTQPGRRSRRRALQRAARCSAPVPPSRVRGDRAAARSRSGFSSIFWNTAWTRRQAAAHAGHPLRSEASGPGRLPDRVPQQLAVVVPGQPVRGP